MGPYLSPVGLAGSIHSGWISHPPSARTDRGRDVDPFGQGSRGSMDGPSAAPRRFLRVWKVLIWLQILLLLFTLAAPIGTMAADPSPSPSDNPSAEPSSDPTPDPTAVPTATPDPTPAATPDPTSAPTQAPDPSAAPDPTPAVPPDASPDPTPTPTPAPTSSPVTLAPY